MRVAPDVIYTTRSPAKQDCCSQLTKGQLLAIILISSFVGITLIVGISLLIVSLVGFIVLPVLLICCCCCYLFIFFQVARLRIVCEGSHQFRGISIVFLHVKWFMFVLLWRKIRVYTVGLFVYFMFISCVCVCVCVQLVGWLVGWLIGWLTGWLAGHLPSKLQEHFHYHFIKT